VESVAIGALFAQWLRICDFGLGNISMMFKRTGRWLFVVSFVVIAVLAGLQVRHWTWGKTRQVRYQHDVSNGFFWGSQTLVEASRISGTASAIPSWPDFFRGYLALYDRVERESYDGEYYLDYPPLRLLVMSIWAREVQSNFPNAKEMRAEHVRPLLYLNLFCELGTAAAVFLLTRLWVSRASGATGSRFMHRVPLRHRAWICGAAAALAAWFDPSMILDAHGWPQWDAWILPFYLFAALAASKRRWFVAGCLLAFGAMLKGQLLFVAPFFLFWPLWQKRWIAAVRVACGCVLTSALIVSPWLVRGLTTWLVVTMVIAVICAVLLWRQPRHARTWAAGLIAITLFSAGAITGSYSWLRIGFLYGAEHYPYLYIRTCYNLPSLLAAHGLELKDILFDGRIGMAEFRLTLQWTLRLIYLATLAACALGMARHARHRDPRTLVALAAPWLVMFAVLGQMQERYLLWGGVVSSLALGVSLRTAVVSLLLSLASTAMIAHVMLLDKKLAPTMPLIEFLNNIQPYAPWLILASVGLFFWETISTGKPRYKRRSKTDRYESEPFLLGSRPERA
jgi:hypothetical protein